MGDSSSMAISANPLLSISHWLPEKLKQIKDHGEALRMRIFLILILLCIAPLIPVFGVLVTAHMMSYEELLIPILCVGFVLLSQSSCLIYFLSSVNINLCSIIYSVIIFILIGGATYFTGGWHSPVCAFMLALPVIACLVISRAAGFSFFIGRTFALSGILFYVSIQYSSALNPYPLIICRMHQPACGLPSLGFILGSLLLFDFSTEDLSKVIKEEQKQLKADLDFDELTKTLNKKALLSRAERNKDNQNLSNIKIISIYIKLQHLKDVNQYFGYDGGDYILTTVAECIKNIVGTEALVSRYTPESFVILSKRPEDIGVFSSLINNIKNSLNQRFPF